MQDHARTAIVLSGGGARGAYEAGVVAGIVEVLGPGRARAPFSIFTGTSVGAINAAWLASHADRPDMFVDGLLAHWRTLELRRHLSIDPVRFLAGPRLGRLIERVRGQDEERWGRSLLDPYALEQLVETTIPYDRLHRNVDDGTVDALVVAALDVATARTTMFAELAPKSVFRPTRDPRRVAATTRIGAAHVLASAAIPILFPSRRVGDRYYCDGGVRFNTPIAPAIRCGADRLVVISLLFPRASYAEEGSARAEANLRSYPSAIFLLGKVLNALLLDPVSYDLAVLERINQLLEVLDDTLEEDERQRVLGVLEHTRGMAYRRISTLVFRPSADIGHLAHEHAREASRRSVSGWVVRALAELGQDIESDLLSFILFDQDFAEALCALGRHDAVARADEIREFFAA